MSIQFQPVSLAAVNATSKEIEVLLASVHAKESKHPEVPEEFSDAVLAEKRLPTCEQSIISRAYEFLMAEFISLGRH